jgi:regulator of cell morphogenesis and NO signaling
MLETEAVMNTYTDKTVREIVIENPSASRVFEAAGIDYCCGGNKPLAEACERANVRADNVLEQLERAANGDVPQKDWATARASELITHVVDQHHGYIRRETPRVNALLDKVAARHGQSHPEVLLIAQLFRELTDELGTHMSKEENVLFPFIERLEKGDHPGAAPFVSYPIARMITEHEDAGALVAEIRGRANGFEPPADACPTFRALYSALHEFERDLHLHVHLENNILFPAAEKLEANALATR